MTDPQNFLLETAEVVEQRANRYEGDYYGTAAMWSSMLGVQLDALDVLRMMMCMKIVRTINDPTHVDSWRDIAGYASLGPQVVSEMLEVDAAGEPEQPETVREMEESIDQGITVSTISSTPPVDAEPAEDSSLFEDMGLNKTPDLPKVYRKR